MIMRDQNKKEENHLHKNEIDKHTEHLPDSEIERMPASDDDYRLPRQLPEEEKEEPFDDETAAGAAQDEADGLIDGNTDISPEEIALLEQSGMDMNSDEAIGSDLLDNDDDDGDALNEGPDDDAMFDLGADLDMPNDVNNPDIDEEDEDF